MSISAPSVNRRIVEKSIVPVARAGTASCGASQEHADPRVRRTRKLLQDAFRELVQSTPYAEISVQHVTDRAGVNRATFYAHYTDKQDLAASLVKADLVAAIHGRFGEMPSFTAENLVHFSVAVFEFLGNLFSGCPEAVTRLHDVLFPAIQEELNSMVHGWLSASRASAHLFPTTSRDVAATVISSSIYGAAYRWVRTGRVRDVRELSREVVAVLMPK